MVFPFMRKNITCCLLRSWEFEGWQPDGTTALHWTHNWQYLFNKNCPTCLRRLWWSKYWLSCKSCSILRMNTSDARVLSSFCSWRMNLNCCSPSGMYSTPKWWICEFKEHDKQELFTNKIDVQGTWLRFDLCHSLASLRINQHPSASICNNPQSSININQHQHPNTSAPISINQCQSTSIKINQNQSA